MREYEAEPRPNNAKPGECAVEGYSDDDARHDDRQEKYPNREASQTACQASQAECRESADRRRARRASQRYKHTGQCRVPPSALRDEGKIPAKRKSLRRKGDVIGRGERDGYNGERRKHKIRAYKRHADVCQTRAERDAPPHRLIPQIAPR